MTKALGQSRLDEAEQPVPAPLQGHGEVALTHSRCNSSRYGVSDTPQVIKDPIGTKHQGSAY